MNKFNLLKYLSKWKYLIFAVCVLGALIVYKYAMYNQEYTASTVISYTGQNAAIYSLILEQEVTGDKETLIKKYQSDISTYELDLQNMEEKINDLNDLITKYSDKNKEGVEYHYGTQSDEGNDASDYILKNVYDEFNQEDGHVQSETTYDTLINEYVDIETEKEKLEVDLEHKKKLLAVFTDGAQSDDMSNKDEIEQSLEELSQ